MTTRHLFVVIAGAALLLATSTCIDDLPAATKCPPDSEALDTLDTCGPALAATTPGCAPAILQCLHPSCACNAGDCVAGPNACYPHGDCPAKVRDSAANASCIEVEPDAQPQCTCGCARCVSICDGSPLSFGLVTPLVEGQAPPTILRVALGGALPARGRLGVYVRLRGQANGLFVQALHGTSALGGVPLELQASKSYVELVAPADQTATWDDAGQRPDAIELHAAGIVALDLDCIIPFVVAR